MRPLEALLRRGDRQAYDEAIRIITDEGPETHREGRAFQHGRLSGNGEWVQEKFRITRETIMAVTERLGITPILDEDPGELAGILNEGDAAQRSAGGGLKGLTARPPSETPPPERPGEDDPILGEQIELMRELRNRTVGATMLLTMPDLGDSARIRAESIALQMERVVRIIWSVPRQPVREAPGWNRELREMTRMTREVRRTEDAPEELLRDYLDRMLGWLDLIHDSMCEHLAALGDAGWMLIRVGNGSKGTITCEPATDGPPGAMECAWPECLPIDPRRCRYSGRPWRACRLPDGTERQTRTKSLMAKHEDLFPWPPEWDEEIRRMEGRGE